MATYSVGFKGANAENSFAPTRLTMDDPYAIPGGQQNAMAHGTPFLCQDQSGQQAYYKIDAERSDPSRNLIFLLKQ